MAPAQINDRAIEDVLPSDHSHSPLLVEPKQLQESFLPREESPLNSIWNTFLKDLDCEFGKETVDRWLRSLRCTRSDEKSIDFEAQNSFQVLWFEEHIRPRIPEISLPRQGQKPIQVSVYIKGAPKKSKKNASLQAKGDTKPGNRASISAPSGAHFSLEMPELDPTALFDSLISTPENELVLKLLQETCSYLTAKKIAALSSSSGSIATWDSSKFMIPNPIYLWGPSGSGKTHLLQATTHRLQRAGLSVKYASSDLFTEHVVKSIRAGEMSTFRSLWRNVDALIVDDIHLLARKSATQEEFFHTFNSLHVAGKQIIVSANCLPQQLQYIEPRLVSRFEWGIVLPVEPLPRKQIPLVLEKKAELLHFSIVKKQIELIADLFSTNVKSSVRALEAFILRATLSKKDHQQMNTAIIKDMLRDLIDEEQKSALTPEKIMASVAEQCGVTLEDITGKSQAREAVIPRQIAMYLIRKHLKIPYMKIGDIFGRDHSTVMSSIKHIEKQLNSHENSDIGSTIAKIEIDFS